MRESGYGNEEGNHHAPDRRKNRVSEKDSRLQLGAALPEASSGEDRAVPGGTE